MHGLSDDWRRPVVVALVVVAAVGVGIATTSPFEPACATSPPTTFSFAESHGETGVNLIITHEGGDPIAAGDLYVVTDRWNVSWATAPEFDNQTEVVAGDEMVVMGLSNGTTVHVGVAVQGTPDNECSSYEGSLDVLGTHTVGSG